VVSWEEKPKCRKDNAMPKKPPGRPRRSKDTAPADRILTHEECLIILSQQARDGSVTAASSLERALRAADRQKHDALDDEFARMLGK
jgi:hypothetical protein